ncbi:MAG: hypothetical protein ABR958_04205 [Dehalococcoidales bacterium]
MALNRSVKVIEDVVNIALVSGGVVLKPGQILFSDDFPVEGELRELGRERLQALPVRLNGTFF